MSRWGWVIGGVMVLTLGAAILLLPGQPQSSPEHRSDSAARDGAAALYELASRLGHPVSAVQGSFVLPGAGGVLFVFNPEPYTDAEADRLADWVRGGGVLVLADSVGDSRVDQRFDIHRAGVFDTQDGAAASGPFLPGVMSVSGDPSAGAAGSALEPRPAQVTLLHDGTDPGLAVALETFVGSGRVIVLGDPLWICNHALRFADNDLLAVDMLGLAGSGAPVLFDEFHHGSGAASPSIFDWAATPWGAPFFWVMVVVYCGFLLRGRAFGPRLPVGRAGDRSSAEYAAAVGQMLRRAHARGLTAGVVAEATRRALAERVGVGHRIAPQLVDAVLRKRSPELARRLASAETQLTLAHTSDRSLLEAARSLHSLAYPSADDRG